MSGNRERLLGGLRRALGRGGDAAADAAAARAVGERLDAHRRGPIPARSQLTPTAQIDLFESMAREQAATVVRVADPGAIPAAVADYLKAANLPPQVRLAPDADLTALPWDGQPLLEVVPGRAAAEDRVSLTGAFAGIAETGTLMLLSGPAHPTTLNFLPEVHIVALRAADVVGPYEDAWARVRAKHGTTGMPRTVNFVTGPSRTADIEQTIQLGAHGPRRLHIILVGDTLIGGRG
jgi:L-lactate dehydrogenase complex protein LldG